MTAPPDTNGGKVTSLRELPQSIEPARDLWPGIEAQLGEIPAETLGAGTVPPRRRGQPLRWLAAAAMVASVALGVWIGRSLLPGTAGVGTPPVSASLAAIEKAKQDLEQALGRDPGNALLQELLVNTSQDEMRVLTDVHEASDPGRGT